jgi:hypothetical protein
MPSYTFNKPNRPDKLMDELITAIPALAPVLGGDGYNHAVFQLWAEGDDIHIVVNDGVNVTQQELQAVIDAHTRTPRPPSQDEIDINDIKTILQGTGNLTQAQIKQALRLIFKRIA